MAEIEALIFDCDGVMFDSRHANLAFYNRILEFFDEPPVTEAQQERAHLCHTASSPQVFAGLLGEERAEQALLYSQQLDYDAFIPQLQPEPGLMHVLAALNERIPLAVATNRGSSMRKILEYFELEKYFRHVVTYLDVPRPKPYPDMLHHVAALFQFQPQSLLFVGDSEFDQRAAAAAGCSFVAYKWEGGQRIDHHCQLLELLQLPALTP